MLVCHPDTAVAWVSGLQAKVRIASGGILELSYRLDGDLSRARIPSPLVPKRVDGLWCHTCFEVFVGSADRSDYLEYNLAPSGHWQAYAFNDYRQNRRLLSAESPSVKCFGARRRFVLQARIRLPTAAGPGGSCLGLCAVLEDKNGGLSYWSLRHSLGAPDFHDPATFLWKPRKT